jgi:hypothetical protein
VGSGILQDIPLEESISLAISWRPRPVENGERHLKRWQRYIPGSAAAGATLGLQDSEAAVSSGAAHGQRGALKAGCPPGPLRGAYSADSLGE